MTHDLVVEQRPTCSCFTDPRNTRARSRKKLRQVAESISTFGFVNLIDKASRIIAGHAGNEADLVQPSGPGGPKSGWQAHAKGTLALYVPDAGAASASQKAAR